MELLDRHQPYYQSMIAAIRKKLICSDVLLDHCLLVKFNKNEMVIHEGEMSKYLFFLLEGKLQAFSTASSGKTIVFGTFHEFRIIGEVASLWESNPIMNVHAETESICLALDLHLYRDKLFEDVIFLKYLCHVLSKRILTLDHHIANIVSTTIDSRLAEFILQHHDHGNFKYNLNNCANTISTSYRHLLRTLDQFCTNGYLLKSSNHYKILDITALEKLAELTYDYSYI